MSIMIGSKSLVTASPDGLDATLIASTGCTAVEAQLWLSENPVPALVEAALRPFLIGDDVPDRAELGRMIAEAGVADVATKVAALYAAEPAPTTAPEAQA